MAEKLQYQLTISTRARGTGARDTREEIRRLKNEAELLTEKVRVQEIAFYNLDKELKRTTASTKAQAAASRAAGTAKGNFGRVAQQAGFQVQDFATQVAAGGSAMTALGQQAPQFLSIFGPAGSIAGALVSLGALAGNVFLGMKDSARKSVEDAEALEKRLKSMREAAADQEIESIDTALTQLDETTEVAKNLITLWSGVEKAQNEAALSALENARILEEAAIGIREAGGEQVPELEKIEQQAESQRRIRAEQARQAIEAQQERLEGAQKELDLARDHQASTADELIKARQRLDALREELPLLQEKLKALQDAAAPLAITDQAYPGTGPSAAQLAQQQAARDLEVQGPLFEERIKRAEEKISRLEESTQEENGRAVSAVKRASTALAKQQLALEATAQEVETEIGKIENEFISADIKARVATLTAKQAALASDLDATISEAEPQSQAQRDSVDKLREITDDNKVTANETNSLVANLSTLQSAIKTAVGGSTKNVQELITIARSLDEEQRRQKRDIDLLRGAITGGKNYIPPR